MKLLVLSPFPPECGKYEHQKSALASFSANLIEAIQHNNKDLKITVFADRLHGESDNLTKNNLTIQRVWEKNDPLIYLKLLLRLRKNPNQKLLIHFEWNIFGSSFYYLAFFPIFLLLLRGIGIKTYLVLHGIITNETELPMFKYLKRKSIVLAARIFYYLTALFAYHVITTEYILKKKLLSIFRDKRKISFIPHGVDTNLTILKKEKARKSLELNSEFICVYFGFLAYYKGPDILIDLFKNINTDDQLYLVGGESLSQKTNQDYRHYIANLYTKASQNKNIKITGFIEENKISNYLSSSDIMIFPYRSMLSSSGPLSLSFTFEKPFLLSRNLKGYFESEDFKAALKQTGINKNDLLFDFTRQDFRKKLTFAKKHIKELSTFSRLMKTKRSWEKVALKYYKLFNYYAKHR